MVILRPPSGRKTRGKKVPSTRDSESLATIVRPPGEEGEPGRLPVHQPFLRYAFPGARLARHILPSLLPSLRGITTSPTTRACSVILRYPVLLRLIAQQSQGPVANHVNRAVNS